ncbi:ABC transporter permease [Silvibacterium dinghuense]|uniref:ABC transporter permease n=1 Tax=Silvibacterium dinghuense TaxID=1560006 RepID=UPI0027E4C0A6|nr:ABC transporter permease [Silvibacterium dinghuense]
MRAFFHKPALDGELEQEMASHLEFAVEENLRQGMSPEEARRQALVRFGGVTQVREQHREERGLPWLDGLTQDVRYTLRVLRKDRGFTAIAVLILALGIGANVAVFSVVNAILLRPLPFTDPDRLVWIAPPNSGHDLSSSTYSADAYDDLRAMNKSYTDVTGYYAFSSPDNVKLTEGHGQVTPLTLIGVAGNFFAVLGVQPMLGRWFNAEETRAGSDVVMLSYPLWMRRFGGDPNIVGKTIVLDGKPNPVIGVLPESFDFGAAFAPGSRVDMFGPISMDGIRMEGNTLTFIGRLKPGVTLGQARSEASTLFPKFYWSKKEPTSLGSYKDRGWPIPLKEHVSGEVRRPLIVLWSAVGMILVIVCVNLSNLLLARAAGRQKEFAMRIALGADRKRIVRQMLTESLILAATGAVFGLVLAWLLVLWLAHQGSIALPLLTSLRMDTAGLVWTLGITLITAVLFGLMPAFRISGKELQGSLKDSGQGMSAGRGHERLRAGLVIAEIALACILLVGAGLLLRSFLHVLNIDLGFTPAQAAAIRIDYNDGNDAEKRGAIVEEMLRRVNAIPGVEVAGITDNLPLERNRGWGISVKGADPKKERSSGTFVYLVTPGYLRSIGMRLREGRDFSWQDGPKSQKVAILNRAGAEAMWPGEDPIGRMASIGGEDVRIIGVIDDVHESNVEGKPGVQSYLQLTQFGPDDQSLVVRSKLPAGTLAPMVLNALRQVNPEQPATELRPIQQIVDHATSPRRFFVVLVASFAGLGLLLASLGIYGVISYGVTQQSKEIGIRMALGATMGRVQLGILRRTMLLAGIGLLVGGVLSLAVAKMIASLLYGTEPTDPVTFLGMILVLGLVALLAGYLPARRASRIDPLIALRTN